MTKMTYVKALEIALETAEGEVAEKLEALKASIEKKNATKGTKLTKTQTANVGVKEAIMAVMADGTARTITEIVKTVPACDGMTNQKVSALVRQLKETNELKRTEVKGVAYFVIPSAVSEVE